MAINLTSFERTTRTVLDLATCTDLLDGLERDQMVANWTPSKEREWEVLKDVHEDLSFRLDCEDHGYLFH